MIIKTTNKYTEFQEFISESIQRIILRIIGIKDYK